MTLYMYTHAAYLRLSENFMFLTKMCFDKQDMISFSTKNYMYQMLTTKCPLGITARNLQQLLNQESIQIR